MRAPCLETVAGNGRYSMKIGPRGVEASGNGRYRSSVLIRFGDPADCMYAIVSRRLQLFLDGEDGTDARWA